MVPEAPELRSRLVKSRVAPKPTLNMPEFVILRSQSFEAVPQTKVSPSATARVPPLAKRSPVKVPLPRVAFPSVSAVISVVAVLDPLSKLPNERVAES